VNRRGRRPIDEITLPQRRTLDVIQTLIEKKGFPPTLKDLAVALEITPASVYDQIKQLTRKGYIKREPRKARSIVICRDAFETGRGNHRSSRHA
jgi:repressor LexA